MESKQDIINRLKVEYPSLRKGSDEDGYIDLTKDEYEATIESWANNVLIEQVKAEEEAQSATAKKTLFAKLGISEDEAKLLLS